MPSLSDVLGISVNKLRTDYIDTGLVRVQFHPSEPLAILNYTEKVTFDRVWDHVTLQCRGLIYNTKTLGVRARPFPKFFNHTEPSAPLIGLDELVSITDKLDGSLGIIYPEHSQTKWDNGNLTESTTYAVATRGSFTSEQALRATQIWNDKYAHLVDVDNDYTILVEIIYPENRIVCDYGSLEDLVVLGAINNHSGVIISPALVAEVFNWPQNSVAKSFGRMTFAEALALEPRKGAEGLVIRTTNGRMVKFKQEDYVGLHRIITGLNARSVWSHLKEGKPLDEMLIDLPEEFHQWVRDVANELTAAVEYEYDELVRTFDEIMWNLEALEEYGEDARANRKMFAQRAAKSENPGLLFAMYDDQADRAMKALWEKNKPEHNWSPMRGNDE